MLGYQLRNTPTLLERIDMFNINRPARRSFNAWVEDLQKLSGVRDVSQEDAQVEQSFADTYAAAEAAEGWHRQQHPSDPTDC